MGLVGLGVMGRNLALNLADKGFGVAACDPWPNAREEFAATLNQENPITVTATTQELAANLPAPRTVLVMVKAGAPVDAVIDDLLPHLEAGDNIIDGGNSRYQDTVSREAALRAKGIRFIGLGVSGGEDGARHGPSLMAGGDATAYRQVEPMLAAIAAKFDGAPCCARMGGGGAGPFRQNGA